PSVKPTLNREVAKEYVTEVITDDVSTEENGNTGIKQPENVDEADLVSVGMNSPVDGGIFRSAGFADGGYYPLSLQYRQYTANGEHVRKGAIGGDLLEDGTKENRSYDGNTSKIYNEYDLDAGLNAVDLVEKSGKDIPVIVALKANNPVIVSEFEAK